MFNKKKERLRRCKKIRLLYKKYNKLRLVVYKTLRNIYAQIIRQNNGFSYVILSVSTLDKNVSKNIKYGGNKIAAGIVGKFIAKKSIIRGIRNVVFDRSGFKYHGRIKILADYARKYGLLF